MKDSDNGVSADLASKSKFLQGRGTGRRELGRKGGVRCMGGGRSGREAGFLRWWEVGEIRKIMQQCAIFCNRKSEKRREPTKIGREPGSKGTGSGRFKPLPPPPPKFSYALVWFTLVCFHATHITVPCFPRSLHAFVHSIFPGSPQKMTSSMWLFQPFGIQFLLKISTVIAHLSLD